MRVTMRVCSSRSLRLRAKFHQQIEAARAIFVGSVGQRLGLAIGETLQLQIACSRSDGEAVTGLRIEVEF